VAVCAVFLSPASGFFLCLGNGLISEADGPPLIVTATLVGNIGKSFLHSWTGNPRFAVGDGPEHWRDRIDDLVQIPRRIRVQGNNRLRESSGRTPWVS
jgi:hypothetical protein